MSLQALHVVLPSAWLAATFLYLRRPLEAGPRAGLARRVVTLCALGLHLALFAATWRAVGTVPVQDPWSTLSVTILALVLLHFATTRFIDDGSTGAIVLALVTLGQLAASAFGEHRPHPHAVRSSSFYVFHVFASVTATAAVVLSGIHGGLYLLLFRRMKRGQVTGIASRLPSLETLAILTRRAALAGFLLLTIGVNFGIGWAHYAGVQGFRYSDPVVVFVLGLWVHFGVVAFSRKIPGLNARRASFAAAAGLTVFVSVFLVALIPELSFHWTQP